MSMFGKEARLPTPEEMLVGRDAEMEVPERHFVLGTRLRGPFEEQELGLFGLGCFWGAERVFWEHAGVICTMVGYAGGGTKNPTYREVCSGLTGHNEVVRVAFDATKVSYSELLAVFWEAHDPTQGMRQGNDSGTQYRSGIYTYSPSQKRAALDSLAAYQKALDEAGHASITTEVLEAPNFYYAEAYHQQYLAKNPGGYCGLGGLGVACNTAKKAAP
jgi:peptide-methionine (S)-S-oxide reductase